MTSGLFSIYVSVDFKRSRRDDGTKHCECLLAIDDFDRNRHLDEQEALHFMKEYLLACASNFLFSE